MPAQLASPTARSQSCCQIPSSPPIFGTGFLNKKIPVFYKFWSPELPINLVQCKVMFTLVCTVSSTTVFERFFMCLLCPYYVLISFSHGYSATLAAKLIIKLELTGHSSVGRHNEYRPKGGDALWLESKGRYGFCLVAGETVWSLL